MLWAVVSSARCMARRLDSPVPSRSAITQLLRRYRRGVRGLEPFHIGGRRGGNGLPRRDLFKSGHELAGVVRVRGVATALQGIREGLHVGTRTERGRVARFPKYADIIRDVFRERTVGAKPCAFAARLARDIFRGIRSHA